MSTTEERKNEMAERPLVSVVIPVYNTKRELFEPSLESVINQTYKNLEIILVDDGSEEWCANMVDEMARRDDRVAVYHSENGGCGAARNIGIAHAAGEYLTFVDSDDIAAPYMIDHGLEAIQKTGAEFAIGQYERANAPYDGNPAFSGGGGTEI